MSNSLNLNFEEESKTTITKANVPTLIRNKGESVMLFAIGSPSYERLPIISPVNIRRRIFEIPSFFEIIEHTIPKRRIIASQVSISKEEENCPTALPVIELTTLPTIFCII